MRWAAINAYGAVLARKRFGGEFSALLRWLSESETWEPEAMRRYQNERLRRVIREATAHVPYYREVFRQRRLTADDIQSAEDLAKLPELTKEDIHRDPGAMLHEHLARRQVVWQTSRGTTGQKLTVALPRRLAHALNAAVLWRH